MENIVAAVLLWIIGTKASKSTAICISAYTVFDFSIFSKWIIEDSVQLPPEKFYAYYVFTALIAIIGSVCCLPTRTKTVEYRAAIVLSVILLIVTVLSLLTIYQNVVIEWVVDIINEYILITQIVVASIGRSYDRNCLHERC